ncbi:hypothetical protein FB451DRAFT_1026675 [Mycena latifolia]|nr:hypothetical protein FB451DRAFT_1026675 [Mycena latifolia]
MRLRGTKDVDLQDGELVSFDLTTTNFPLIYHLGFTDFSTLKYSYEEHDYPLQLPVEAFGHVAMTLQGSSRLELNLSDAVARDEWTAMLDGVKGYGRLRLGPERRMFVMTWFHQLHCLWEIQNALIDRSDPQAALHHLSHCFTYLRQTLLCEANGSLEEGDFMVHTDYSQVNYVGDTMVCNNWEKIQGRLADNFQDFEAWRTEWL